VLDFLNFLVLGRSSLRCRIRTLTPLATATSLAAVTAIAVTRTTLAQFTTLLPLGGADCGFRSARCIGCSACLGFHAAVFGARATVIAASASAP
jgi:hypothetical protein